MKLTRRLVGTADHVNALRDSRGSGILPLQVEFSAGFAGSYRLLGRVTPEAPWREIKPSQTAGLLEGLSYVPYVRLEILTKTDQLATPTNGTHTTATTGGTLPAGTYTYRVSALDANGETLASAESGITTTGSTSTVTVVWGAIAGATGYRIYGRAAGGQQLMAEVGAVTSWLDDGSITPSGALPAANTTGAGIVSLWVDEA